MMIANKERGDWLREARLAAGFNTAADLARAVGVRPQLARAWERGQMKPTWGALPALAQVLSLSISSLLAELWQQRLGDACRCGCGGITSEPHVANARTLPIGRTCPRCLSVRIYSSDDGQRAHSKLCGACSRQARGLPTVLVRCVGYPDHHRRRHAVTCRGTKFVAEGKGRRESAPPLATRENPHPAFVDIKHGVCRCGACALGARTIARRERELARRAPGERARQRIESAAQRQRLSEDGSSARFKTFVAAQPKAQAISAQLRREKGLSERAKDNLSKGQYVKLWRGDSGIGGNRLPNVIITLCLGCHAIVLRRANAKNRTGEWHRACLAQWQGSEEYRRYVSRRARGLPVEGQPKPSRGKGRPVKDDLKRDLAWAIAALLDTRSFADIGRQWKVSGPAVHKAVRRIIGSLPSPDITPIEFRRLIRHLREAAREDVPN